MRQTVIGLLGHKRSGKDSIYRCLADNGLRGIHRLAFADELKVEVAKVCGVTLNFLEEFKEVFRPMLQWWGTDFRRRFFHDDYWIRKVREHYWQRVTVAENIGEPVVVCVFTDVRFPNEAALVRELGGKLWRVVRDIPGSDPHSSETVMNNFAVDRVIENNGTLEDLRHKAMSALVEDFNWDTLWIVH